LALLRRAEREFAVLDFLNATCTERSPFLRELGSPTMEINRANLVLDTPSLSANSSGVLGAKSICTFFGIDVLHVDYTPGGSFPNSLLRQPRKKQKRPRGRL
jgi:hypothetical protein